jgi:hypothetical protein
MNILQPYNDDTLELISDVNEYNIVDFITNENGKVKLSVFTESNVFQDSEDLQKNIDFYTTQDSHHSQIYFTYQKYHRVEKKLDLK